VTLIQSHNPTTDVLLFPSLIFYFHALALYTRETLENNKTDSQIATIQLTSGTYVHALMFPAPAPLIPQFGRQTDLARLDGGFATPGTRKDVFDLFAEEWNLRGLDTYSCVAVLIYYKVFLLPLKGAALDIKDRH